MFGVLTTPRNFRCRVSDRMSPALAEYVIMQASKGAALIRLAQHSLWALRAANLT